MALTAYVLGNITMLTTKVDQSVLEYRANVTRVRAYLDRKVGPCASAPAPLPRVCRVDAGLQRPGGATAQRAGA